MNSWFLFQFVQTPVLLADFVRLRIVEGTPERRSGEGRKLARDGVSCVWPFSVKSIFELFLHMQFAGADFTNNFRLSQRPVFLKKIHLPQSIVLSLTLPFVPPSLPFIRTATLGVVRCLVYAARLFRVPKPHAGNPRHYRLHRSPRKAHPRPNSGGRPHRWPLPLAHRKPAHRERFRQKSPSTPPPRQTHLHQPR